MSRSRVFCLLIALCTVLLGVGRAAAQDNPGADVYYLVRQDLRKCPSPYCGGFFIRAVNQSFMSCADGVARSECYVTGMSLPAGQLNDDQQSAVDMALVEGTLIIRGQRLPADYPGVSGMERLLVEEAWRPLRRGAVPGMFYRAGELQVQCAAAECLAYRVEILNAAYSRRSIRDIAFAPPMRKRLPPQTRSRMASPEGLLVAGTIQSREGSGERELVLYARQVYLPLIWEPSDQSCYQGGCSGEICSASPGVVTSCIYKPVFACYAAAQCERQPSGQCGWTPTPALVDCIEHSSGSIEPDFPSAR